MSAAAIFALDLWTPPGVAVPILYVALAFAARISPSLPLAIGIGLAITSLTVAGCLLSSAEPTVSGYANRVLVIVVGWLAVALCQRQARLVADLEDAKRHVQATTEEVSEAAAVLRAVHGNRRRVEAELAEKDLRYHAVFDQTFQLFAILDQAGTIQEVNETLLSLGGSPPQEFKGRPLWTLPLWSERPETQERLRTAIRTAAAGSFYRDDLACVRAGGGDLTVDFSIKPIREAAGRVDLLIFEGRDVTEHRRDQEIVAQKQRLELVGSMTSGVAHDVNNLLTVIGGNLQLAARRIGSPERAMQRIEKALEAVFQGKSLTRQLLAFARKQELAPSVVEANGIIEKVISLVARTLPATIEIRVERQEDGRLCWADPTQLQTAVLNLVMNAADAMPEGGRITVRNAVASLDGSKARGQPELPAGDYQRIDVIDEGGGIPAQILDRVIEPFFTTKPPDKGSGLGLSMVYGFVKQSSGDMRIDSQPGRGTTVSLYLPLARDSAPGMGITRPPARAANGRTLVVERDANLRDAVVTLLADLGYETEEAADGDAAVERVRSGGPFDCVLADAGLLGPARAETLTGLARSLNPRVKILYGSADRGLAETLLGRALRDDEFVGKPYRYGELTRILAPLLPHMEDVA